MTTEANTITAPPMPPIDDPSINIDRGTFNASVPTGPGRDPLDIEYRFAKINEATALAKDYSELSSQPYEQQIDSACELAKRFAVRINGKDHATVDLAELMTENALLDSIEQYPRRAGRAEMIYREQIKPANDERRPA